MNKIRYENVPDTRLGFINGTGDVTRFLFGRDFEVDKERVRFISRVTNKALV
jgi:hypothetical protein